MPNEARRTEIEADAESDGWILGEGAASPLPPARGLEERCKLIQRGSGGAPTAQRFPLFSALRMVSQDGLS